MRDYGNLKALGHYNNDNITVLFLRGERQDLEEMRIIEACANCTCLLVVPVNDGRRNGSFEGVPFFTAVSREVVPAHIKRSDKRWLNVIDRKTGEPLNGNAKREHQAIIQRAAFDTAQHEQEAAE
ncbi:MAG: hypothetical protein ABL956_13065 [Hyphomonadaceae bacterium]